MTFQSIHYFLADLDEKRTIGSDNASSIQLPFSSSYPKKHLLGIDDEWPSHFNVISGVAVEAIPETEVNLNQFIAGERTSIMKTITNLWTGNPANFLPLEYPISSTLHFFPDSLIAVREEEPSSIIAFTLG